MSFNVGEVSATITADSAQFNRALDDSHRRGQNWAQQMGQSFQRVGGQMQSIGRQASMYVTAPIVGIGGAAMKMSMDFESSMSKVTGLVGESREQVAQWSDELLSLAPAVGKTPQELAEGLYFVTSAGFEGAEALDVLETSARASAAGLGDTQTVADLVTSAINAYGIENLDASQAADILTASVREGKAEASELAGSMGQVLPIASELGVTFDEVGAATAAMTRTGTDAATAGTQLRQILASLLSPTSQAEETLSEMGLSSSELRRQIDDEGLLSVLETLREKTNEYGEDAMSKVFPNIRALSGVLDIMGKNAESNAQIFDELSDSTGALDHAFETVSETAEFKWAQAMAHAQSNAIELGDAVQTAAIPVLEEATEVLSSLTDWFRDLDDEQQQNIVRWAGIAAAIGPVLVVGGALVKSVGAITTAIGGLGKALIGIPAKFAAAKTASAGAKTAFGAMGAKVSALAGPIGIAAAGIGYLAYTTIEETRRMQGPIASVSDITEEHMGRSSQAVNQYKESIEEIDPTLKNMANEVGATLSLMTTAADESMDDLHDTLVEQLNTLLEEHNQVLEQNHKKATESLNSLLEAGLITEREYAEALAQSKEHLEDQRSANEDVYNEINTIVEDALEEYGKLHEEHYEEMAELLKEHLLDREREERQAHIRQTLLAEEFHDAIRQEDERSKDDILNIWEEHARKYQEKVGEHYGELMAEASKAYEQGVIDKQTYDDMILDIESQKQTALEEGQAEHLYNLYKEHQEHFHEVGVMVDRETGDIIGIYEGHLQKMQDISGQEGKAAVIALQSALANNEPVQEELQRIVDLVGISGGDMADALADAGFSGIEGMAQAIEDGELSVGQALSIILGVMDIESDARSRGRSAGEGYGDATSEGISLKAGDVRSAAQGLIPDLRDAARRAGRELGIAYGDAAAHAIGRAVNDAVAEANKAMQDVDPGLKTDTRVDDPRGGLTITDPGGTTWYDAFHEGGVFNAGGYGKEGFALLQHGETILPANMKVADLVKHGSPASMGGGSSKHYIQHTVSLENVPAEMDQEHLERVLVDVLSNPGARREVDKQLNREYERYRAMGGG